MARLLYWNYLRNRLPVVVIDPLRDPSAKETGGEEVRYRNPCLIDDSLIFEKYESDDIPFPGVSKGYFGGKKIK